MRVAPRMRSAPRPPCPRCWRPSKAVCLSTADYCELLGLYLGDGHISVFPRSDRLRVAFDSKYPGLIERATNLLRRGFPCNRVSQVLQHNGTMTILVVYHSHLRCLFPQHGPGPKHHRPIFLEPWQEELVAAEPWALIRGLIASDGSSFINRTGPYEYLSYDFSNTSTGIATMFLDACRQVGVRYRINLNRRRDIWQVRINRRPSVALMLEHVGIKS